MKNILVTGADGQLGKTIKDLYLKNNIGRNFIFITKNDLDITDEEDVKSFFSKNDLSYCVNCAAYTNVEQAEITPQKAYKVNAEGVKYLAEACKKNNVILIHISTDYVFDGEKEKPYKTKDTPNPINEYGKSKLLGEEYIHEILDRYFIIRTSWLYSKKYGKNFYRTILEKAKIEKEIYVTNKQTGCPTNTESLAVYLAQLIIKNSQHYGIHHFSDGKEMTWYEFAQLVIKWNHVHGVDIIIENRIKTKVNRPKYSVLE